MDIASRFRIVGRLGSGGMAEVLLARRRGGDQRGPLVVLKRLLPHLRGLDDMRAMFIDEGRVLSRLRHRNIVQVHELVDEDEEQCLVLEYLEGECAATFAAYANELGRIDPYLGAFIVAEAAAGLEHAHTATDDHGEPLHIVHRDVSPQNIFLTYEGEVKLLDFGIARFADKYTTTDRGILKGKLSYMAPELFTGAPADARSDVFALGVVLYEVTTGRRLFKRSSEAATIEALRSRPIKKPRELIADYPEALERVCFAALARQPAQRTATAGELRRQLLEVLRQQGAVDDWPALLGAELRALVPGRRDEKRRLIAEFDARTLSERESEAFVRRLANAHAGPADLRVGVSETRDSEPAPRHRSLRWIAAALGGTAGLTLALLAGLQEPSIERTPTAAAPAGAQIELTISSDPLGAHVTAEGIGECTTPCTLRGGRSDAEHQVHAQLAGYRPALQPVRLDRSRAVHFALSADGVATIDPPVGPVVTTSRETQPRSGRSPRSGRRPRERPEEPVAVEAPAPPEPRPEPAPVERDFRFFD